MAIKGHKKTRLGGRVNTRNSEYLNIYGQGLFSDSLTVPDTVKVSFYTP